MSSILSSVGTVVDAALGWSGDVVDMIVDTPLLLLFCTLSLVGLGIGFVKRLIRV